MTTKGRKEREIAVEALKTKIENAKSIVFADYHGLGAQKMSELRLKLRDDGAETNITKNTLMKIALKEQAIELNGPTMTVFSYEDAIASIKTLFEFAELNDDLPTVKAGIVEGQFTSAENLNVLSKLPGKEQLIAQVIGTMQQPITGIVGVLNSVQRNFVYALSEIAKKKES